MNHDHPHEDAAKPLSVMLREVGRQADRRVSVGDVVEQFGRRALGAVLFLFCVLNLLPWPPGGTTITGTPLLLVSIQVAVGVRTLWLPRFLMRQDMDDDVFRRGLDRILPPLERVEQVSRPRLGFMFGPVGDRVLGLVCTLLSLIIVLPIFGGNFLPAVAATLLAVSLVQRDGVLALAGYAMTAVSAGVLILLAGAIIEGIERALQWVQGLS